MRHWSRQRRRASTPPSQSAFLPSDTSDNNPFPPPILPPRPRGRSRNIHLHDQLPALEPITTFSPTQDSSDVMATSSLRIPAATNLAIMKNNMVIESLVYMLCQEYVSDPHKRQILFRNWCRMIAQWNQSFYFPMEDFPQLQDHQATILDQLKVLFMKAQSQLISNCIDIPRPTRQQVTYLDDRYSREFDEVKILGKGAFGLVVKAQNKLDGGFYAIKIVTMSQKDVENNLREVQALARLSHPHIVRYHSTWLQLYLHHHNLRHRNRQHRRHHNLAPHHNSGKLATRPHKPRTSPLSKPLQVSRKTSSITITELSSCLEEDNKMDCTKSDDKLEKIFCNSYIQRTLSAISEEELNSSTKSKLKVSECSNVVAAMQENTETNFEFIQASRYVEPTVLQNDSYSLFYPNNHTTDMNNESSSSEDSIVFYDSHNGNSNQVSISPVKVSSSTSSESYKKTSSSSQRSTSSTDNEIIFQNSVCEKSLNRLKLEKAVTTSMDAEYYESGSNNFNWEKAVTTSMNAECKASSSNNFQFERAATTSMNVDYNASSSNHFKWEKALTTSMNASSSVGSLSFPSSDTSSSLNEGGHIVHQSYHNFDGPFLLPVPKMTLFIQLGLCGESLKEWLHRRNETATPVHGHECLEIFRQMLSAVQYIHSQNLIHRDIKPANIFFTLDHNRNIQLGDFGLARPISETFVSESDAASPSTAFAPMKWTSGTQGVGTPIYASPEILAGSLYNAKSDMHNLGIILLELFQPFKTDSEKSHVIGSLKSKRCLDQELMDRWPHVTPWILHLTHPEASHRPSAEEVLASPLYRTSQTPQALLPTPSSTHHILHSHSTSSQTAIQLSSSYVTLQNHSAQAANHTSLPTVSNSNGTLLNQSTSSQSAIQTSLTTASSPHTTFQSQSSEAAIQTSLASSSLCLGESSYTQQQGGGYQTSSGKSSSQLDKSILHQRISNDENVNTSSCIASSQVDKSSYTQQQRERNLNGGFDITLIDSKQHIKSSAYHETSCFLGMRQANLASTVPGKCMHLESEILTRNSENHYVTSKEHAEICEKEKDIEIAELRAENSLKSNTILENQKEIASLKTENHNLHMQLAEVQKKFA